MSKFNSKSANSIPTPNAVNEAGGASFQKSAKLEIVTLLLNSLLKTQYYRGVDDQIKQLQTLANSITDKKFLAKLAVYARTKFGMRSITHVAAGEVAKHVKGESWTKNFLDTVIYRPDDMTEIMSYYLNTYGKPIPNCMKKGFASAFNRFNGYSLGKYRAADKEVSLVDIVNLCRPRPTEEYKDALKALVDGKLRATDTWETKLTQAGQNSTTDGEKAIKKAQAWKEMLSEGKLGYFAAVRNINNIMKQADDETFKALMDLIVNRKAIKKSLLFPYRFLTAITNLDDSAPSERLRAAKASLSIALDISCDNIPELDGRTLVVIDYSGSMGSGMDSEKGKGTIFGVLMAKAQNADVMIFGNDAVYLDYNPADLSMSIIERYLTYNSGYSYSRSTSGSSKYNVGHGTNFGSIFTTANKKYDRIMIFSDMQGWVDNYGMAASWKEYKKRYDVKTKLYSFDLGGYSTMMFPEKDVYCLAGFSDKIFDVMALLEEDPTALINEINKVQLG